MSHEQLLERAAELLTAFGRLTAGPASQRGEFVPFEQDGALAPAAVIAGEGADRIVLEHQLVVDASDWFDPPSAEVPTSIRPDEFIGRLIQGRPALLTWTCALEGAAASTVLRYSVEADALNRQELRRGLAELARTRQIVEQAMGDYARQIEALRSLSAEGVEPPEEVESAASAETQVWRPTHRVPEGGLQAWHDPGRSQEPDVTVDAGLPVEVVEVRGDDAHVRASNGWMGWVDAGGLVPGEASSSVAGGGI